VDVPANGDWSFDRLDVVLLDEDLLDLLSEYSEVLLGEALARFEHVEPLVSV